MCVWVTLFFKSRIMTMPKTCADDVAWTYAAGEVEGWTSTTKVEGGTSTSV